MRLRTLALAGLIAALPLAAQAKVRPAQITAQIDKVGAQETVSALVAKHKWNRVLGYIGTGRAEWLGLAPRLAAGTDGSQSEGLTISLADALTHNPAGVLDVVGKAQGPLALKRVCSAPFIEPIAADLASYKAITKHALESVTAPRLMAYRHSCLVALRGRAGAEPS